MRFKTKLRKIGNSSGVLIPKDIIESYSQGEEIELEIVEYPKIITDKSCYCAGCYDANKTA